MRCAIVCSVLLLCAPAWAAAPVGLRAGETAPHDGVLLTLDDARACGRVATLLGECQRDLAARVPALPCVPMRVEVEVVRVPWWPVVVAGVVGIAAGGAAVWMVTR